jgi:hypothetical protein
MDLQNKDLRDIGKTVLAEVGSDQKPALSDHQASVF